MNGKSPAPGVHPGGAMSTHGIGSVGPNGSRCVYAIS